MFHSSKPSVLPPPRKPLVVKLLLQLLNSCSCFCNVVKKVAVIGPVLYLLYHLEFNFSAKDPCLRAEIGIVVEGIVSYVSICCSQYLQEGEQGLDGLGVYIMDLLRVWTVDQIGEGHNTDVLASFFLILNNEFHQGANVCLNYLAGVVMNETLLLRLCLTISPGTDKGDLQRDTLKLAVQTIKGFQNFYFLDMLLKMLLEPSLPAAALMSSEDEVLLRKALFDAVMLVDYSFYSGRWLQSSESYSKNLALVWVLVADCAIQFARSTNDEARAISYLKAFCESQLVTELIKWAGTQAGIMNQDTRPDISIPKALIRWLLLLHERGIRVFDQSTLVLHAKVAACMSRVECDLPELEPHGNKPNQNIFVSKNIDENKDQEMGDLSNNGFPEPLCPMDTKNAGKKRKEEALSGLQELRVKQLKRDFSGSPFSEKFLPFSGEHGLRFGNEVKNFAADDDMELIG